MLRLVTAVSYGLLILSFGGCLLPSHNTTKPRMKLEVTALDQAMEAFKERFSCYPPDGTDQAAIKEFLATAFPRYTGGLRRGIHSTNAPLPPLTPATALVFWLGGMQDAQGNFIGFQRQPGKPDSTTTTDGSGRLFDFQALRIPPTNAATPTASLYQYFPDNGIAPTASTNSPYLYFAAQNGVYPRHLIPAHTATWFASRMSIRERMVASSIRRPSRSFPRGLTACSAAATITPPGRTITGRISTTLPTSPHVAHFRMTSLIDGFHEVVKGAGGPCPKMASARVKGYGHGLPWSTNGATMV